MGKEPLLDPQRFGLLLRAARQVAGYDRASDFSRDLATQGVEMSEDVIYYIERGKQSMKVEQYFAALLLLKPAGGHKWFAPAFREDVRRWLEREA